VLFSLYLSDFGSTLSNYIYNFYADDLIIYLDCKSSKLAENIKKINENIENIVDWITPNQLLINEAKMQAIIIIVGIHYINAIDFDALSSIVVEIPVRFVTEIKYLGIVMSSSLSWDKQCNEENKS